MLEIFTQENQRKIYSLQFDVSDFAMPSLSDSLTAIESLDLSIIIYKISQPDPSIAMLWEEECAKQAVQYYKNYLWLLRKYSEEHPILPPSIEIDEIWHHHILDTYQYAQDCKQIFGQFLHHYPYFGMRGAGDKSNLYDKFELTQQLHFKEFGDYILSFETT